MSDKLLVPQTLVPADLPPDPDVTYDPNDSLVRTGHFGGEQCGEESTVAGWTLPRVVPDSKPASEQSVSSCELPPHTEGAAWTNSFLLRNKIGEGGFGDVWEAVQMSLGRTVAVKRLKATSQAEQDFSSRDAHRAQMERAFCQEAMTAAHLEHPNVVPIYDLGADEEGRPLLAMKMVKGRQWRDIIHEDFDLLPVPEFLAKHVQILISVTQAVAFAHSHRIIHRDLKPAQVMIGPFGEVLLMDWGLAMAYRHEELDRHKILWSHDADSPLYHPVNPAGTPSYMAPEQTETSVQNLGPWTDVFLLGAILYELLTGMPPHRDASGVLTFRRARAGVVDPPEMRASGREIPSQLSALAMKAMTRNPDERVESVEAFLSALQDYLSGADKRKESAQLAESVAEALEAQSEYDYPFLSHCLNQLERSLVLWPANARSSLLRQAALARYASMAIKHRDLKLARVQAERLEPGRQREQLLEEILLLEQEQLRQQERLAQAHCQAKADRDRAEGLVRFLLGDLYQALKPIGRLDIVHRITQQALNYFDSLAQLEATDETLFNRCIAYLNIGDVESDEGRKHEAEEAYAKAREIALRLVERQPQNCEWLLALADSYDRNGQIHYYQGRAQEALLEHTQALEIRQRVVSLQGEQPGTQAGIAITLHKMGIIFWRQQDLERALDHQTRSLGQLRRLSAEAPEDSTLLGAVSWNLSTLGNVYRDLGQLDQAIAVTQEALDIRETLAAQQPANSSRKDDLLWTRGNLALLYLMRNDLERSLELFEKDMQLRRRLSEQDPTNVVRLGAMTFPLSMITEILFALGRTEKAEATIRECLQITRSLLDRDPTSMHVIGSYARQCGQLAEILIYKQCWQEAEEFTQTSAEGARKVCEAAPRNSMATKVLARALLMQARFFTRRESPQQALQALLEAKRLIESLNSPGDEVDMLELSAQYLLLSGESQPAQETLERLRSKGWVSPYLEVLSRSAESQPSMEGTKSKSAPSVDEAKSCPSPTE